MCMDSIISDVKVSSHELELLPIAVCETYFPDQLPKCYPTVLLFITEDIINSEYINLAREGKN